MHTPRKRFGQNFLQDASIIDQMVAAVNPRAQDHIVEIGPGQGALTEPLIEVVDALDVVELDRDLIPILRVKFITTGKLTIHESDVLKFDFTNLIDQHGAIRVVGNLPYNISTQLMFYLLEYGQGVSDMHFLLQKEVVDRLAAEVGTSHYSRLSVWMQYHCDVEPLFLVPPESFYPVPKVMSQFVRLVPKSEKPDVGDEQEFKKLITQSFAMRRKTIRNNLKGIVDDAGFEKAGILPTARAQDLSLDDFVRLKAAN